MMFGDSRFYNWLLGQKHSDLRQLQDYAKASSEWKKVKDFRRAWEVINANDKTSADEKKALINMAILAFQSFDSAQPQSQSGWPTAFGLGVFTFMATILAILILAIFEPTLFPAKFSDQNVEPLLSRLANLETSRGLITFVFTVGVIALALIIVTANVMTGDGEGARFERSKEILTSLIAILGTILGFYFGKAETEASQLNDPPVIVTDSESATADTSPPTETEDANGETQ